MAEAKRKRKKYPHHPLLKKEKELGELAADRLTKIVGSWYFIFALAIFMTAWIATNLYLVRTTWDPYPFILLNFVLSTLAAVQAPIILMSQNRSAKRDRSFAEYDHKVNKKAEKEIQDVMEELENIKKLIKRK